MKKSNFMFGKLLSFGLFIFFSIFLIVVLAVSVKGYVGNPKIEDLNSNAWRDDGPLELSPERGRFGLTYSLVEDQSSIYNLSVARFIVPDLGMRDDGKYVSLFAPGVSFLTIPGYLVGKYFGASQLGAYSIISLIAVINALLIIGILRSIGANKISAYISSLLFLFGSPAFTYAVNLYQHHVTVLCLLLSLFILIKTKNIMYLSFVWLLYAASFIVDYPNVYLLAPVAIASFVRILQVSVKDKSLKIDFKFWGILTFFSVVLPVSFLLWYNSQTYNNPFQLAGTIESVKSLNSSGLPVDLDAPKEVNPLQTETEKTATGFFKSRNILRGFIVNFLGMDRGMIFFTPVMLIGFIGMITSYRKKIPLYATMSGTAFTVILLYSMWGDPWGGWAFGSRYLIPAYAVLSIFLGLFLTQFRKNILILLAVLLLGSYSIAINTVGALTSSRNPPKVEVLALEEISGTRQRYSFDRNFEFLQSGKSKSAFWTTVGHKFVTAQTFYLIVSGSIVVFFLVLSVCNYPFRKKGIKNENTK